MRGRDRFNRVEGVLTNAAKLLSVLPTPLAQSIFVFLRNTPTQVGIGLRYILAKRLTNECGKAVAIMTGCYILHADHLTLGEYVSIHPMCYLECVGGLVIGSNVALSHGVSIITHEHDYLQTDQPMKDAPVILKPVIIEDDVWVGAGSRILAGVIIGRGSVVGAGSVVTKSVPEYTVVAGVPAREISKRQLLTNGAS